MQIIPNLTQKQTVLPYLVQLAVDGQRGLRRAYTPLPPAARCGRPPEKSIKYFRKNKKKLMKKTSKAENF